jgi:hypothetical protein
MMALGAPAELLLEIQQAAADEVRHAQGAVELLSALKGVELSFGALPTATLSLSTSRAELMALLLREACVNETLGVAELGEALARCAEPKITAHLKEVIEDETRHASLAWRSLKWLLEGADELERGALCVLAQELTMSDHGWASPPLDSLTEALNAYGVLSAEQVKRAHQRALREVITPCLIELDLLTQRVA